MVRKLKYCDYDEETGIFSNPHSSVPVPDGSIVKIVFDALDKIHPPDYSIIVDVANGCKTYTIAQLKDDVRKLSYGLHDIGLTYGDVVTVYLPNSYLNGALNLAILSLGGISAGIYHTHPEREVTFQAKDNSSKILICTLDNLSIAISVVPHCPALKYILLIGDTIPKSAITSCPIPIKLVADFLINERTPTIDDPKLPVPLKRSNMKEPAYILYSSGSTGIPKGAIRSHGNQIAFLVNPLKSHQGEKGDKLAITTPIAHMSGTWMYLGSLYHGTRMIMMEGFELKQFLDSVQRFKVTNCFLAPIHVTMIAKSPLTLEYDISSLKCVITGGAPLSPASFEAWKLISQSDLRQLFGSTEGGLMSISPPGETPFTSGHPDRGVQFIIVDRETKLPVPLGQTGEVWTKADQVSIGYWGNPDADTLNFTDGWWMSGDAAFIDADGLLNIVSRYKELIKVGIAQVPPSEVEAVLKSHPMVKEAAVIGIPDDALGEIPKAFVTVEGPVTESELKSFTDSRLGEVKQIKGGITILESFPLFSLGKIDRKALKQMSMSK